MALGIVALFAVVAIVVARDRPAPGAVTLASAPVAPMPVAVAGAALTTTWYCPGMPANNDAPTGDGVITVMNPTGAPLAGAITLLRTKGVPVTRPVSVAPHAVSRFSPVRLAAADFTGAVVEMFASNAVVAQTTTTPLGTASAACASSPSPSWFFANGSTTVGVRLRLVVLNPFPEDAVVDFSFAAEDGSQPRRPGELQGLVVKGQSVKVVDVDAAVERYATVASSVVARSGRIVVGRYETLPTAPRRGFVGGLGAPSAGAQWWFAGGRKGEGVSERVIVYNPGDDDATADVTVFPATSAAPIPLQVTVSAHQRVSVDISRSADVPAGRHSLVVSTGPGEAVVPERELVLDTDARRATTSQLGSRLASGRWYVPVGGPAGGHASLAVVNTTGVDAKVAISTLGPRGTTSVKGLAGVPVAAGASVDLDLTKAGVGRASLVVSADTRLVVEQFTTPAPDKRGAASALGVPLVGSS
jgi:hypothetical protein